MSKVYPKHLPFPSSSSSSSGSSPVLWTPPPLPSSLPYIEKSPKCSNIKEATFTVWMKSLLFNSSGCTVFDRHGKIIYRIDTYGHKFNREISVMDIQGEVLLTLIKKVSHSTPVVVVCSLHEPICCNLSYSCQPWIFVLAVTCASYRSFVVREIQIHTEGLDVLPKFCRRKFRYALYCSGCALLGTGKDTDTRRNIRGSGSRTRGFLNGAPSTISQSRKETNLFATRWRARRAKQRWR